MRPSMLKRLERFNKGIEILNEIKQYTKEEFCSDIKLLSIAERNLQVCIDFLIDLPTHILSKIDAEIPETYKENVEKLHNRRHRQKPQTKANRPHRLKKHTCTQT